MEYIAGSFIILIFCITISCWEYSRLGTVISPFGVLAWPYAVVVCMINIIGRHFGFFGVSLKSILFVVLCMVFFCLGGMAVRMRGSNRKNLTVKKERLEVFDRFRPLYIILALVAIAAAVLHFVNLMNRFELYQLMTKQFRDEYGSGALSHIMLFGRPAFVFLFADYIHKKRWWIIPILVAIVGLILIRQVKYHIIVLILASLYYSYYNGLIRFNFKKLLFYSVLAYLIFDISYSVGFSALGISHALSSEVQSFLFNHFFTYLFGGPIGFSEILKSSAYPLYTYKEVFAVPINIVRFLHREPSMVDIVIHNWVVVSNIYKYFHSSNVFTMFGTLYAYIGPYMTLIYCFFTGLFSYMIASLAAKETSSPAVRMFYSFILGFLTLSFFGFYFNMLPFVEICLYTVIFPFLFSFIMEFFEVIGREYRAT